VKKVNDDETMVTITITMRKDGQIQQDISTKYPMPEGVKAIVARGILAHAQHSFLIKLHPPS